MPLTSEGYFPELTSTKYIVPCDVVSSLLVCSFLRVLVQPWHPAVSGLTCSRRVSI